MLSFFCWLRTLKLIGFCLPGYSSVVVMLSGRNVMQSSSYATSHEDIVKIYLGDTCTLMDVHKTVGRADLPPTRLAIVLYLDGYNR